MKHITRDRLLTTGEADRYDKIREQISQELPELISRHHDRLKLAEEKMNENNQTNIPMGHQEIEHEILVGLMKNNGWTQRDKFWYHPKTPGQGRLFASACKTQQRWEAEEERKRTLEDGTRQVLCNKCGEDVRKYEGEGENRKSMGYYGLVDATFDGGYFSTDIRDGDIHTFSLCEKCVAELMKTFKIPPITVNYFD